jgi:hypothetical protein
MINKITVGTTKLEELHEVFKISENELESKKARLFPIGNTEQEPPTVSIFLSSLSAVKEYREELFLNLGINKIRTRNVNVHAYVEIQDGNKNNRPDGLIVITSGKITPIIEWAGFVEAKISDNMLEDEQVERYTDFAREIGISDIITISNFLVTSPLNSPINSKKRSFNFYHWSWAYLKVMASRLIRTNSIEDEDHVYILTELRKYFDTHKNLKHFTSMGKNWKESVMTVHGYSHDQKIKQDIVDNIVTSIVQEEKDISLQLTDNSDFLIELVSNGDRKEELEDMLQTQKAISSQFMIDGNKKNTFFIDIDFIRQEIRCYTHVIIDKGKAQAQTTALLKTLTDIGHMDNIFINAIYPRNKHQEKDTVTISDLFNERQQGVPLYSILNKDLGDIIKYFEIKTKDQLGKNFLGNKNFIVMLEDISERFLEQVMVNVLK